MRVMIDWLFRIVTVSIAFWVVLDIAAQVEPTPTAAPSKTPTSAPQVLSEAAEAGSSVSLVEPLTQADLSILTGNVQRPNGITWYNNKLYTSCSGDWTIYELDDRTGATVTYIYPIRNAHTLYAEGSEDSGVNLWVPDFQRNALYLVNPSRQPEAVASELNGPWGIAYLNETQFLVTNMLGNTVVSLERGGGSQELVSHLRSPTGIATDGEYIYVANNGSARRAIEWFAVDAAVGEVIDAANMEEDHSLVSGLQNATGLVLSDGYLYFAYSLGTRGVVGRVEPHSCIENGSCSHDQVEIVLYTELAAPLAGLTISPDKRLFVHTMFSPDIYWAQFDVDGV